MNSSSPFVFMTVFLSFFLSFFVSYVVFNTCKLSSFFLFLFLFLNCSKEMVLDNSGGHLKKKKKKTKSEPHRYETCRSEAHNNFYFHFYFYFIFNGFFWSIYLCDMYFSLSATPLFSLFKKYFSPSMPHLIYLEHFQSSWCGYNVTKR